MTPSIFAVSILFVLISLVLSAILKSKFNAFSKIPVAGGLSGREIAEKMLMDHGITGVKVVSVSGFLSDHYNPLNQTINLSPDVYEGRNIAAAAVAAHETGHAVQHARAYPWLMMRSRLVPVVQASSGIIPWILLAGVMLLNRFPSLLLAGIILFAITTLFSLITLPVEINASQRALAWLKTSQITSQTELPRAKEALTWAALTYVLAALASIVTLLQYLLIYQSGRRR